VIVDVDQSMSCMTQETFGPTLPLVKVNDAEEAIRLANDSPYGLSATVWTRDKKRGEAIARRLDVGAVNVNDVMSNCFAMDIPMGGWKQSGIGARLGGAAGLRKYCRAQAITSPLIPTQSRELLWYPASRRRARIAATVLRAAAARGRRRFGLKPRGA
jgi:acyl-CoA reductase-like NAD-dependent aldehyde dehydrogenase